MKNLIYAFLLLSGAALPSMANADELCNCTIRCTVKNNTKVYSRSGGSTAECTDNAIRYCTQDLKGNAGSIGSYGPGCEKSAGEESGEAMIGASGPKKVNITVEPDSEAPQD